MFSKKQRKVIQNTAFAMGAASTGAGSAIVYDSFPPEPTPIISEHQSTSKLSPNENIPAAAPQIEAQSTNYHQEMLRNDKIRNAGLEFILYGLMLTGGSSLVGRLDKIVDDLESRNRGK